MGKGYVSPSLLPFTASATPSPRGSAPKTPSTSHEFDFANAKSFFVKHYTNCKLEHLNQAVTMFSPARYPGITGTARLPKTSRAGLPHSTRNHLLAEILSTFLDYYLPGSTFLNKNSRSRAIFYFFSAIFINIMR